RASHERLERSADPVEGPALEGGVGVDEEVEAALAAELVAVEGPGRPPWPGAAWNAANLQPPPAMVEAHRRPEGVVAGVLGTDPGAGCWSAIDTILASNGAGGTSLSRRTGPVDLSSFHLQPPPPGRRRP